MTAGWTLVEWLRDAGDDRTGQFERDLAYQARRVRDHAISVRMHNRQRRALLEIADELDFLVRVVKQLPE